MFLKAYIPEVTDTLLYSGDWAEVGVLVATAPTEGTDFAGE